MGFPDNVLEINIKPVVIPIVDTGLAYRQNLPVSKNDRKIPAEFESRVAMLRGEDDVLKVIKTIKMLSHVLKGPACPIPYFA